MRRSLLGRNGWQPWKRCVFHEHPTRRAGVRHARVDCSSALTPRGVEGTMGDVSIQHTPAGDDDEGSMAGDPGFQVHEIIATLRFVQGYRFLDRCGEALVKLEKTLAEGWIPLEANPTGGGMRNAVLGMVLTFNSERFTVQQAEFISFDHFRDQVCRIHEVLWRTFEIEALSLPTLKVVLQRSFEEEALEEAEGYMRGLGLCVPRSEVLQLMGGKQGPSNHVLVTEEMKTWSETGVCQRRRLVTSVVRQERREQFDARLVQRARLLPSNQRAAIQALNKLRRQHPELAPVAAQLEVEHSFETEFPASTFDLPLFLDEGWQWTEQMRNAIPRLEVKKHG